MALNHRRYSPKVVTQLCYLRGAARLSVLLLFVINFNFGQDLNRLEFTNITFPSTNSDIFTAVKNNILNRNKRMLIFPGAGGVSKCTLGVSFPVDTQDKVNWRTMNMGYNLQGNYLPLNSVIWPWSRFHRSLINQRTKYDQDGTYSSDGTREFIYSVVETIINRNGDNGRECVLRAICEAAKFPIRTKGIFDEILHLFLTPNENEVNVDYVDAMLVGKYGVDCQRLYSLCASGRGLLDRISVFN